MKIYLVDNTKITKFVLPSKSDDFFSYTYMIPGTSNTCLITFEKVNDKWILKSNGVVNVYKDNTILSSVEVLDYSNYQLKIIGYEEYITIYFMCFGDELLYQLDISQLSNISIGNSNTCNICYYNNKISPNQVVIKKEPNGWVLSSIEDIKYYTYVNNYRVIRRKLKAGDTIFIDGLKIIWMQHFIIINNPNNLIKVTGLNAYNNPNNVNNTEYLPVSDEEQSIKLFGEDDYFYHTPRISEVLDEEEIKIETPPQSKLRDDQPFWLTIGTSVTMSASALMMGWNVGYGLTTGRTTAMSAVPQIVMCGAMVFGSLIMPRVVSSYQKKQSKKLEEKRISKFSAYLDQKEKDIDLTMKRQAQILRDNSLSPTSCKALINNITNRNFWSREINDNDFLEIHLGIGSINNTVKISAPEEKFTLEEDGLLERVLDIEKKYEKLNNVPIKVSLVEKNISAFVCNDKIKDLYIDNIILQLVTLHSGADLKIVIFTNENNADRWEYTKYLPHCFSEDKNMRYFVTNLEEAKEVSSSLEEVFKERKEIIKSPNKSGDAETADKIKSENEYKNFSPYFLIICDNYKNNLNIPIITDILNERERNYGFSFSIFTNTLKNLPPQCNTFIEVGTKDGCVLERNISSKNQQVFSVEYDSSLDMRQVSNYLLNIPFATKEGLQILPTSLSFLEMYGVSKIEQLNILNRWKTNNPVISLSAPVGVYADGEQFKLNLHEKFHGPHGLIAGMTGSGKSEFIITYILSMALNYSPNEVSFILIDYKGGGLAGAFQNKETGIKIPHLVGTITNLDTAEMNRTLVSIESELKRRQKIFNETKDMLGESTIDIYKYQRLYREGSVKEPMAHLFIISDEFAELKSQQPEFMQQLISTARIGRSLGVHLILATQKPSGVVNDQIWSNSKFKVCLKVQDRSDSMEMLKKPDAASIKEAGRFYLQVGYDDFFDKGQSGWAGAKYVPSDKLIKKVDDSIDFIDNIGNITKSIKDVVKVNNDTIDYGDQLTNIVKSIYQLGEKEQIRTKGLWLDAIPEKIYIDDLKKKYNYKPEYYFINPVIGEYDNPSAQEQGLLNLNMTCRNTAIYGQVGSGKENLLSTIIWSTCIEHTPEEVNMYIIDCGSEALKKFINMPHVGDVATIEEQEKVFNTMVMVEEEIEKRKDLMVDYGGSYQEYIDNSGKKLPLIVVIINNYEVFTESFSRLSDSIQNFYRDGAKYGIVFVVSAISVNTIKMRMLQNFTNKLCLQIPNVADYRGVVNAKRGQIPSKLFGRGLVATETTALEFQTAMFCDKKNLTNFVISAAKQLSAAYSYKAKSILVMPDVVTKEILSENKKDISAMPIGIAMDSISPCLYDFTSNKITNILASELQREQLSFVKVLIDFFYQTPNLILNILDLGAVFKSIYTDNNYYANDFDNAILNINNIIMNNKQGDKSIITIVVCAGLLKSKLNSNGIAILNNLFNKLPEIDNSYFVFIDTYNSIRNLQTDIWYQNNVNNTYGIWLGEGIGNQVAININDLSVDHRKAKFPYMAFVVNKGKYEIIKHITENGE